MRRMLVALLGLVILAASVTAQSPARFRWQQGQVLLYRVEHTTHAVDTVADSKSETKSIVKVTKKWHVSNVDKDGVATLQLSLTAMMQERTTPSGEVLKFDSSIPDKGTPQLKEALSKYLNTTLATIRVDSFGKVIEVKESKSDASTYENELPFFILFPPDSMKPGKEWDRTYKITLAPPVGTGEQFDSIQKYTCKAISGDIATIQMSTELKSQPKAAADAIPLWQMMPVGELTVDLKTGKLQSAKLTISKELKNHQGEKSETKFNSTLTVQLISDR